MTEEGATLAAAREVEVLVRALAEQLTGFRRRALAAETRVRELEALEADLRARVGGLEAERDRLAAAEATARRLARAVRVGDGEVLSAEAIAALREENGQLRGRLAEVGERTRAVLARVHFARQQLEVEPVPSAEGGA
jgi:chromosome segregation ATPase